MRIEERDILDVIGPAVICHQVNCVGIMGGGLALQVRNRWDHVYQHYLSKRDWELGDCQIVRVNDAPHQYVANLAGQVDITPNATEPGALVIALRTARDFANANGLTLYIPYMIGCGIGGGDWDDISRMIENTAPHAVLCKLPKKDDCDFTTS